MINIKRTLITLILSLVSIGILSHTAFAKDTNQPSRSPLSVSIGVAQVTKANLLIQKYGKDITPASQVEAVEAYLQKAQAYQVYLNDPQTALTTYDTMIMQFSHSSVPDVQVAIIQAFNAKADLQIYQLNTPEAAVNTYDDLIAIANKSSNPEVRDAVKSIYEKKIQVQNEVLEDSESATATYDQMINSGHAPITTAKMYLEKGMTQVNLSKDWKAGIQTYNTLITKFEDSTEPEIMAIVAEAYLNKGYVQETYANHPKDAINTYLILITKFEDNTEASIQEQVRHAYLQAASVYDSALNIPQAAIQHYDLIISKFESSPHEEYKRLVSSARYQKEKIEKRLAKIVEQDQAIEKATGLTTETLEAYDYKAYLLKDTNPLAAIDTYDALINTFSGVTSPKLQNQVIKAYFDKARIQKEKLNKLELAIQTYDDIIRKYQNSNDPSIQSNVAKAYAVKASEQGGSAKIATNQALIKQFGNVAVPNVQAKVIVAHTQLGLAQLKRALKEGNKKNRSTLLSQALDHFKSSITLFDTNNQRMTDTWVAPINHYYSLLYSAYAEHLQGNTEEATALIRKVFNRHQEWNYQDLIDVVPDTSLPENTAYIKLVDTVKQTIENKQ